MRKELVICDNCGKETRYPAFDDWVFFQCGKNTFISLYDKADTIYLEEGYDFCCVECLTSFLKKRINNERYNNSALGIKY